MNSRLVRLISVLLALAMIASACGGGSDAADTVSGGDATEAETSDGGGADDEPADEQPADDEPADQPAETEDTVELVEVDESEDPVFGGTLRYALEADVDGLNPVSSALSAPGLLMGVAVFDTLAVFDDADQWQPYLAESFTPNNDFTVWTMKLRAGVSFHDGTPLNAAAIAVNFGTVLKDPLVGLAVRPFYNLDNPIEIVDDLTVRFNLSGANASWPTSQTGQLGMVASPAWLEAALLDPTLNQAPVGTGPFVFESRSEDSVTRMVRNETWWNGDVYLDAVEFVTVTDPDTRNDLLFQGEIQALQTTNAASVDDLRNEEGLQNLIDDSGDESFIMVNSAGTPFDDIRARKALTFATPRQNYIDLIGLGIQQPADQMFTPASPYYNADVQQEADQPELVADLVASYCGEFPDNCTDGKIDMEFQWSGPSVVQTRIAELLDEGWSVGFNVKFQELPQDAHIQEVAFGVFDVVSWRQFGAANPADDRVWIECATIGGLSLNWPRFCDEDRDAILNELALATTVEARQPLLAELSEKIQQDYLYVFMLHTLWDHSFAENVRGMCGHKTPSGDDMRCVLNGRTWLSNVWLAE
ncbi:MAG: ABC transporter substrate-binding protein [Acidimicrobiales bacterium]